jgi:hypothetical protein
MLAAEQRQMESAEFRALVEKWPAERISALVERCSVPKRRVAALLSVGATALNRLCEGRYTPSPALCRRMEHLEQMAERGELHGEYVSDKSEVQRKMTLFRQWFLDKPPTVDFPLVTVAIKIRWSRYRHHEVTLPIESLPKLRLTRWAGIVEVVRAVTSTVRELARANSRLLWTNVDAEFWQRYAHDALPKIVEERSQKIGEKKHGV